jgi:hypothetical protein
MNTLLLKALYRIVGDVVDLTKHPDFGKGRQELDPRKRFLELQRKKDKKDAEVVKYTPPEKKIEEDKELTEKERSLELSRLGKSLLNKKVGNGKIVKTEPGGKTFSYPVLKITVDWPVGRHTRKDDYYIQYRDDDEIRIEYNYNKNRVGKDAKTAANKILEMIKAPYEVVETWKKGGKTLYVLKNLKSPNPNDRYQGWAPDVGGTSTFSKPEKAKEQIELMAGDKMLVSCLRKLIDR